MHLNAKIIKIHSVLIDCPTNLGDLFFGLGVETF